MSQFNVRDGLLGVAATIVATTLVVLLGMPGLSSALAVLIVGSADPTGGRIDRARVALGVTAVGTLLTFLGVLAGDAAWSAALLIFVVTFAASMTAVYGTEVANSAYLLNLWVVLTLLFSASDHDVPAFTVAFAVGGLLATVLVRLRGSRSGPDESEAEQQAAPDHPPARDHLTWKSPVLRFSALRALAMGVATAVGYAAFPEHAFWMLLTTFLVIKPQRKDTIRAGAQRAAGTLVGLLLALVITSTVESDAGLIAAFLLAAFGMMAVAKASYALFSVFLTVVVVLPVALVQGDSTAAAWERLLATLLGVALAMAIVAISVVIEHRGQRRAENRPGGAAQPPA